MAEDINKKITIEVEAETGEFNKSATELNKTLDDLLKKQKQFTDGSKDNTKALQDLAAQIKAVKTAFDSQAKAIEDNTKVNSSSKTGLAQNKEALDALLKKYEDASRLLGDNSKNAQKLNKEIGTLTNTIVEQGTKLTESRKVFDLHKGTTDALKGSFDKLKDVSGDFGPSLKEAAEGFEVLKTGLSVVETGFTSVGQAIKTTGFGLLVLVLQSVVEYLTKTTEGNKLLKGAISTVGLIVEKVNKAFENFGKFIVDAVTQPVKSIEALGNIIRENIVNRFKAFSVILDGIIHLDFKKMADGAIQAFSGIANATTKIGNVITTVKKGVVDTAEEMANAYKKGYTQIDVELKKHEKSVKGSNKRISKLYQEAARQMPPQCLCDDTEKTQNVPKRQELIEVGGTPTAESNNNAQQNPAEVHDINIVQQHETKVVAIKKTALQQVEDFAKQSAGKMAVDALNAFNNNIRQQSEAKIASLEKDKAAELTNRSLTSAQRLAIEQKYRKQEAAIKIKAFKDEQKASIAQAVINGAIAVTKTEAQTGILGALAIPAIIAETAIQVATITAQKPPAFAQGGLHYSSDGHGGLLSGYSRTDNTNAYLRSGEGIVVSEAMQVPWARNLVSAINVGFGGRDFSIANPGKGYAVGGIFTDGGDANRYYNQPVTDQKNLANSVAYQMINNFPPVYVDVKDINNQQNILAQTINRVNL
jgi:hypothetical protein